jgi:adenine-specific DNA-methyltransferase
MAKKDYSNLTKEQLLEVIEKLEGKKKYGLVWDEERIPEKVVTDCQDKLPILTEIKEKEITTDENEPTHILIEGDNYHALSVLNYTHKGKIDLIYIDPPYNTGNNDFKYNDSFVDRNDTWRHSKWLTFMSKRLELAKELLTEKGIIFISIDDNEQAQLKLLCNSIFGEENFITNIIWESKTGASDAKTIDTITEYILVYVKSPGQTSYSKNKFSYEVKRYRFTDEYEKIRGPHYTDNLDRGGLRYSDSLNFPIECPDGTITYPNGRTEFINDGWTWKWGVTKVKWGLENGYITFKKSTSKPSGWAVLYKNYMYADNEGNPIERSAPQKNVINDVKTGDGASLIKQLFEHQVFKYSKPIQIVDRVIDYVELKDDAIILDFFAGSGTTGHSILKFNSEFKSKRQFIICTNNEGKICDEVTYPRIYKAIKGYKTSKEKQIEGLGNNLKYFKTSFVANSRNKDQLKIDITKRCTEMLCLKEGIFNLIKEEADYKIFQQSNRYLAVYYDFANASLDELKDVMNTLKGEKVLYCFTVDTNGLDKANFSDWKNIRLEPIPQKILDVYKRIFRNA